MLPSRPNRIEPSDIARLIGISEHLGLEFKREPYRLNDNGRGEILKDVSALANAGGGFLVIGVEEDNGVASKIVSFECENPDQFAIRISDLIRSGISPSIPAVDVLLIPYDRNYVMVIRLLESGFKPHRVVDAGRSRYYIRTGTNVREMTDSDIKACVMEASFVSNDISGRVIRPNDLISIGKFELKNQTMDQCLIKGPATLAIVGGVFEECQFNNCQSVIIRNDMRLVNVISVGFTECTVKRSTFSDLILFLPLQMYEAFVQNVPGFEQGCLVVGMSRPAPR